MDFAEAMSNYPENDYEQEEEVYEDENSDNNSDSDSSSEEDNNAEEDEDTYIKFVQSVFCDDYSGCSNDEEEGEEDYVPDPKEADDNDDDSDEDDRDLIRIQNRELRELVDGCWQTIVGEAPPVQPISIKDDPNGEAVGSPQRSRVHQTTYLDQSSPQNPRSSSSRSGDQTTGTNPSLGDISNEMDEDIEPSEPNGSGPSSGAKLMPIPSGVSTGPNAISSMVSKLLLDNDTTEVCVEGLPVTAIRNIVARQMSMATQLLTQILLQADQDSDCFTKGYTSLMELSNLREAALKKASLVQMNFRNATAIRNHTIDLQNQKRALHSIMGSDRSDRSDFNDDEGESENESQSEEEEEVVGDAVEDLLSIRNSVFGTKKANESSNNSSKPANVLINSHNNGNTNDTSLSSNTLTTGIADSMRRLTRSAVQHTTVHTMFNMPILGKVSTLFDMVDLSRRKIKQQLAYHRNNKNNQNSSQARGSNLRLQDQQADDKAALLNAIRSQIFSIMPKLQMRAWKCLLPTLHYPLPAPLMRSLDPSTLMGRCLFTPTEDDLLLRGIMYHPGEGDWEGIRAQYMPSKVAQTLQFRYTQMTSLTATMEDNNYKRFQKLEADYRNRDSKWSSEEELQLLKAFQVLGNRWPLVRIFYLPHRKVTQLKLKWTSLQKTWQRAFQGGQAVTTPRIGYTRELTNPMRTFLEAISPDVSMFPAALTLTPMSVASLVCASPTGMLNSHITGVDGRKQGNPRVTNGALPTTNTGPALAHVQSQAGPLNPHQNSNGNTLNSNNNSGATNSIASTQRLPSISTLQVPPIAMNTSSAPLSFPSTTAATNNNAINTPTSANAGIGNLPTLQQQQQQNQQQQQLLQQQMQLQMQQFQQMYPYMPAFMMPGANLKMPTTQEEFLVYQQQLQFQQFVQQQQQYQMFLHQQQLMNQQINPNEANNAIGASNGIPLQLQQPMQLQQQQLLAQQMQNMNPNILPNTSATTTNSANLSTNNGTSTMNATNASTGPTDSQPNTTDRGSAKALSEQSNNNISNPSTTNNAQNANKRTRRIRPDLVSVDPELRSPSSSLQGLLQEKDNRTTSNSNKGSSAATEDPQASRSVSFLLNRSGSSADVSLSQFHDLYQNQHLSSNQDSIFSLLCPGDNSIPFGDSLSIPYLESSEEHSSSSSNEPFPALATEKQSQSVTGAKLSQNGPVSGTNGPKTSTTTAVNESGPTLKGILAKHAKKKKTIKPTLISAATATAGATVSNVFDAPSTTNALNLSTITNKAAGSRSNGPSTLPKTSNNNNNNNNNYNQNTHSNNLGSLYGDVSLSGLEGLSCLQWGDASQAAYDSYSASNSASASNSSGIDDTRLSALGAPLLPEMSLLDASRFSFSNFAPPRFDSYSDESNLQVTDSRASKSNSKGGSKNSTKKGSKTSKNTEDSLSASRSESKNSSKSSNKGNTTSKKNLSSVTNGTSSNNNQNKATTSSSSVTTGASRTAMPMSSFGSPLRGLGSPLRTMYTRSALASPAAGADLYPFDETSNMSLLGDLFGDGDFSAHPPNNAGGDNLLSPLRSHSKPPLHASWNSPQAQRRLSTVTDASAPSNSNAANKKRPHSSVNGAERASGDTARPFQNISARPGIATQPSSQHSTHLLNGTGTSRGIGPSPKKQKKAGGLFAEVMAKSQR